MLLSILIYLALGACAGLLAGLLGIGGGLVIVAALVWILPAQGFAADDVMHVALATSLASIVLTGLSSARSHHRRGSVMWPSVLRLVPGMLVGGALGAALASALSGEVLRLAVALFCFMAAAQLAFGTPRGDGVERRSAPTSSWLTLAGSGIGGLSAIVGIGGGSMTVPLLVWLGVAPVRAVGTSSACGVAIGLASAVSYALVGPDAPLLPGSVGYVYLPAALGLAGASVLTAPLGTRLAHRLSGVVLKRVFALFLLLVGSSLLLG